MARIVITHAVEEKHMNRYQSKQHADRISEIMAPFGTDAVVYVAADGSNRVATAVNIHNMAGLMTFSQSPEAAANLEADGVIQPIVFHVEPDHQA